MKLFKEHAGQYLTHILPDDIEPDLDAVASISEAEKKLTISIINRHLYDAKDIYINLTEGWKVTKADIVTADNVRDYNTFEKPERISDHAFEVTESLCFSIPKHSVVRICLEND